MKITPRELDRFLGAPDKGIRATLVYGVDAGLAHERVRALLHALLGPKPDPLARVPLTAEQIKNDPAILRDELAALNLMGGPRVIVLQGSSEKLAESVRTAFEGLASSNYLIIEAEELAASSGLRRLFEQTPHFAALACYREEGRVLEQTVRYACTAAGLRIAPDALAYLAQHLGSDHGVTLREVEKLIVYMGNDKDVTLARVREITQDNMSDSMDDLCHAFSGGDAAEAYAIWLRLLQEGAQPIALARVLMRHFQRLALAKASMEKGMNADDALAALRPPVFYKYLPVMKRVLTRPNAPPFAAHARRWLLVEKHMKSGTLPAPLVFGAALLGASSA